MIGTTHRLGGIIAGLTIPTVASISGHSLPIITTVCLASGAAIGSLIPDIDHEGSMIGKKLKPVARMFRKTCGHRGATHTIAGLFVYSLVVFILAGIGTSMKSANILLPLFIGFCVSGVSIFIYDTVKKATTKRYKKTHRANIMLATFVIGALATYFATEIVINLLAIALLGSSLGYLSHLLMDCFTVSGVELFAPFTDKVIKFGNIHTGSYEEQTLAKACVGAIVLMILVIVI